MSEASASSVRILVTGVSGFIGRRLVHDLVDTFGADRIVALSGCDPEIVAYLPSLDYRFPSDYLLRHGYNNIEYVIHLGAFIPKRSEDANDIDRCYSNIASTKMLLDSLTALSHIKRIIYISTIDVYQVSTHPLDESSAISPSSLYGLSKFYCERMIQAFCTQYNIEHLVLRLGHVYGEGEEKYKKALPSMISAAIRGSEMQIYGRGYARRSYIYVADVAKAIMRSLTTPLTGVINVVGDEPISMNDLAELIRTLHGGVCSICHVNEDFIEKDSLFDPAKMAELLPEGQVSFREGLAREIAYMSAIDSGEL